MSRRPQGDLAIPGKKAKEFALVTSREDGLLRKLHQETEGLTFRMTAMDISNHMTAQKLHRVEPSGSPATSKPLLNERRAENQWNGSWAVY